LRVRCYDSDGPMGVAGEDAGGGEESESKERGRRGCLGLGEGGSEGGGLLGIGLLRLELLVVGLVVAANRVLCEIDIEVHSLEREVVEFEAGLVVVRLLEMEMGMLGEESAMTKVLAWRSCLA